MALMNPREPTTLGAGEGCLREGRTPAAIRDQHGSDLSAPSRTPTLLPGRGTKLLSIQTSPVTNVMLVNKPPAGHQGTTQAQTRSGRQARAHPEPGRGICSPKCVLVGGDYERAAKFIAPSCRPQVGRRRGNARPEWGATTPSPAPSLRGQPAS